MGIAKFILHRLKEPSTYGGFSGLALALGVSGQLYSAVSAAIAGVAGLVAILLSENNKG